MHLLQDRLYIDGPTGYGLHGANVRLGKRCHQWLRPSKRRGISIESHDRLCAIGLGRVRCLQHACAHMRPCTCMTDMRYLKQLNYAQTYYMGCEKENIPGKERKQIACHST